MGFGAAPPYTPECRSWSGAAHLEIQVHYPAQAHAERRQARGEHVGVADHGGVGLETRGLRGNVGFDVLAAHLLFALDEELHVYGQAARGLQEALDSLDRDVDLPLVVGRSAGEDIFTANIGLEGRRLPLLERIGRLHVIVAVEQQRGLSRGSQPLRIDQRVAFTLDQFGVLQARAAQFTQGELGRPANVRLVLGKSADTRDSQKGLEPFEKGVAVLLVVVHTSSSYAGG